MTMVRTAHAWFVVTLRQASGTPESDGRMMYDVVACAGSDQEPGPSQRAVFEAARGKLGEFFCDLDSENDTKANP